MVEWPMTFEEWCETTGGSAAAIHVAESDDDRFDALEELLPHITAEAKEAAAEMFAAYHSYICAFIVALKR